MPTTMTWKSVGKSSSIFLLNYSLFTVNSREITDFLKKSEETKLDTHSKELSINNLILTVTTSKILKLVTLTDTNSIPASLLAKRYWKHSIGHFSRKWVLLSTQCWCWLAVLNAKPAKCYIIWNKNPANSLSHGYQVNS